MNLITDLAVSLAWVGGVATTGLAALTFWVLLTQPLTVANAVSARDLTPLAQAIASALFTALAAVVRYL
jgi:hypothetical protein